MLFICSSTYKETQKAKQIQVKRTISNYILQQLQINIGLIQFLPGSYRFSNILGVLYFKESIEHIQELIVVFMVII